MTYKTAYEKTARFFNARPIAKKCLLLSNLAVTGVFYLAYFSLCIASFFLFSTKDIIKIFAIPVLCLLIVILLRVTINRPRPYSEKGANIEPILHKKSKDKESFPSRHLASAFVIACVFFPFLTWAGILLMTLGVLLGFIRFALGLHYPTDLLGGMGVGLLCGLLMLI